MKYNPKLPDDSVNIPKHSPLLDISWMLGGVVLFIFLVYVALGILAEYGVRYISVEQEKALFSFMQRKGDSGDEVRDEQRKVQGLLDSLNHCAKSEYDFALGIIDHNETNAFALPGGNIMVTQGLLDTVHSENELAFVLSHEIGHFQNRDHLEGIAQGFIALALSTFLGISEIGELAQASLQYGSSVLSQKKESEADLFAVDLLVCHYGHVGGATDFFRQLPQEEGYAFFATHPKSSHRMEAIEAHIREKKYKEEKPVLIGYTDGQE